MPRWIWQLDAKILNYKLKHLLAYFWWCGDRGCQRWNYAIANRFNVSHRTIRRWIKTLQDKHLIFINFPMKTTRTIYRRPYYSILVWWQKSGQIKDLTKKSQDPKNFAHSRPKVAYISNAQRKKKERRFLLTPFSHKEIGEKHADSVFSPSNAGGLGCSRGNAAQPTNLNEWAKEKLRRLEQRTESKTTGPAQPESDKVKEM